MPDTSPRTVARFGRGVGWLPHRLAEAGKKVATIQRHAATIAKAHELAGLESPTADKKTKVLLKGIAREKKTRIKQAAAFTLASFKRTTKSINVSTLTGLRNRALLLLGLTGLFGAPSWKRSTKTSAMIRRYTRLDNVQQHNSAKELGM